MTSPELGAIQTLGTCWFYSIINGLILSDDGKKILYAELTRFYKTMNADELKYFHDSGALACPLRGDILKAKRIFFYKFLDQFLCYMSGPRAASLKMHKSAEVLQNISLAGTAKQTHGITGAHPQTQVTTSRFQVRVRLQLHAR